MNCERVKIAERNNKSRSRNKSITKNSKENLKQQAKKLQQKLIFGPSNTKENDDTRSRELNQCKEKLGLKTFPIHYPFTAGEKFKNKYSAIEIAGEGTFSRVFKIQQLKTKKNICYAMKILKPIRHIEEFVKEEIAMLELFKQDQRMLQLIEHFQWRGHYCLVFEYLSISLCQLMIRNQYVGFPITGIQTIAKCLLQQLDTLHKKNITHTDLKTENLVFINHSFEKYYEPDQQLLNSHDSDNDDQEQQHVLTRNQKKQVKNKQISCYYLPKTFDIKIIDFGSATHENYKHSKIINTRQYRAPEVILQSQRWDTQSDMWCVGCILLELYTGSIYFRAHEDYEHLAMIEKTCGPIPFEMIQQLPRNLKSNFSIKNQSEKNNFSFFDWPLQANQKSFDKVTELRSPKELIHPCFKEFRKLVQGVLQINPSNRLTAEQALQHQFFTTQYEDS